MKSQDFDGKVLKIKVSLSNIYIKCFIKIYVNVTIFYGTKFQYLIYRP